MEQPNKQNQKQNRLYIDLERAETLKGYHILNTLPEEVFDNITKIAAAICHTPISLISLVDDDYHWFKSKYGIEADQISRDISFCEHAIQGSESVFEISDASTDERFKANPLVVDGPRIGFYAAAPLISPRGHKIGALSVIDMSPKKLLPEQKQALRALADQVMVILESKKSEQLLKETLEIKETLEKEKAENNKKVFLERERLTKLFEQAPEPIGLLTGPDHVYTFLNAPFKRLFFPDRDPIGMSVKEALPEAVEQGFLRLLDRVFKTGIKYMGQETPFVINRSDGKKTAVYLDFVYDPIRADDGTIEGVLCFAVDVTEKVIARLEAEQRAAFQKSLFDTIPQITFHANVEGHVVSYNSRWHEYVGTEYSSIDGYKQQNDHVIHPDDMEETSKLWSESIQTGKPYEVKHRIRRHDGQYRWHICRAMSVKDEADRIVSWIGSSTDVHDQISTQTWLQQILNLLPKPLFLLDYDQKIVSYSNRAATELLSHDFSGTLTHSNRAPTVTVTDLQGNSLPPEMYPSNQVINGKELLGEEFILTINGIRHHVEAYSAELPLIEGTARSAILLLNDITPLKATEEKLTTAREVAENANKAKSQFLANMSHEIRSPLGAIMGFSSIITTSKKTESEIMEYGSIINRNSKHLLQIVDDILDLSKVEAGMMVIENIDFSFKQLLLDITSLMSFKAEEKGIKFEIDFEKPIPERITSDPTRIRQILSNIVGNAVKFTSKGSVKLTVVPSENEIQFLVKDTGIGISAENISKLFVPFQQADNSTTRKFGGTGLGLALSRKLVQALGGNFDVLQSEVGVGSTFQASIKVHVPKDVDLISIEELLQINSSQIPAEKNSNILSGVKILLVEDSPDNQVLIQMILRAYGAKVEIANDGKEGLNQFAKGYFDLVLCDLQMPRMDGYEMIKELRKISLKMPVIALTAHAMKEDCDVALKSGFTDYLTKPINTNELLKVIKFQAGHN